MNWNERKNIREKITTTEPFSKFLGSYIRYFFKDVSLGRGYLKPMCKNQILPICELIFVCERVVCVCVRVWGFRVFMGVVES